MSILLISALIVPSVALANQTEAQTAINSTKEQLIVCYQATRDAESAGANITSLVAVINDANELLSQAELAYSANDFDTAQNLAVQSQATLGNLASEANILKETAIQQQNQDFMIYVVGSIVATFVVLGAGVGAWFFLKKRYMQSGAY